MSISRESAAPVRFPRIGFWHFQILLVAVALTYAGMYRLIGVSSNPLLVPESLLFSLIAGNCAYLSLQVSTPLYASRAFPQGLFIYLAILLPVSATGSGLSFLVWLLITGIADWHAIPTGIFVGLVAGVAMYMSMRGRVRLEERNRELETQVTTGRIQLQTQEAEIRAAHDIQAHLLPRETPQMRGLQVSCAWQPAQSVGGDYFDVLALKPGQIGLCLADVSGKGIAAALLMANLQAMVRAFAPDIQGPGALCRKLNEVLCGSVAPGKFVTLFYGVIDSETLTLRFENAGHCPPMVLRGDSAIMLGEGGTVLGLFPRAEYEERSFALRQGDCLLLTTDGVTEAADEMDEQFGAERVTASARASRGLGAHGIRTQILDDVSRFCKGKFDDDASLIVVTVE